MFWKKKEIKVDKVVFELRCDEQLTELLKTFRIFLADYLIGKESDLKKLRIELMRPLLEEQWKQTDAIQAEKINRALESKGEKIRKNWNQYKEDLLQLQKQGKDTKFVESKLEVLDKLMEGVE
jgi:hypothetical protein